MKCWDDVSVALSWTKFLTDEKHFCSLEITARQPNDYIQTFQSLQRFASESKPNINNSCPEGILFGKGEMAVTDCSAEPGNSLSVSSSAPCFCSALNSTAVEAAIQKPQACLCDVMNYSNKKCVESIHQGRYSLVNR